jgi:hypothetical protein
MDGSRNHVTRRVTILGRPLSVTTLNDVIALRGAEAVMPPPDTDPARAAVAAQLLRAGWRLTPSTLELIHAARSGALHPGVDDVREVHLADPDHVLLSDDRLTLRLTDDLPVDEARELVLADRLELSFKLPMPGVFQATTVGAESALDAAERLASVSRYRFVEPVFDEIVAPRWRPGSSNVAYRCQWQWRNDGDAGGLAGSDTGIEQAWNLSRGRRRDGSPVRIAVIDLGCELEHPALAPAITRAAHYRFVAGRAPELVPHVRGSYFPPSGHGTACAGLAAARGDGVHGCGAAPDAELHVVGCLRGDTEDQTSIALALLHAAFPHEQDPSRPRDDGAHVVSCSVGSLDATWPLTSVLDEALRRVAREGRGGLGVPIFWAVANDDVPLARDEVASHPAVIAIGSSNRRDEQGGCARGPRLDLLAPGVEVASTLPGGAFGPVSGASFAAPIAAGIAALMLARNPGLTAEEIRQRMRDSCDRVGTLPYDEDGRNDTYGSGRVNAARAVSSLPAGDSR